MIEGGRLFAIPYTIARTGGEADLIRNNTLIQHLVDHPMWHAASLTPEELRVNAAWLAANPEYMKWEAWNGGRLAGMLLLSRVTPPVDALFHFTFLGAQASGVSLFGAKKLIVNFLGFAFEQFNLRRISMEIPEHYPILIRFARQKLGFRYESEGNCDRFNKLKPRATEADPSMRAAFALHGSRKEGVHWNGKSEKWEDIILLRLTREEYEARRSSELTTRETPVEVSSREFRIETSPVQPADTEGRTAP